MKKVILIILMGIIVSLSSCSDAVTSYDDTTNQSSDETSKGEQEDWDVGW